VTTQNIIPDHLALASIVEKPLLHPLRQISPTQPMIALISDRLAQSVAEENLYAALGEGWQEHSTATSNEPGI